MTINLGLSHLSATHSDYKHSKISIGLVTDLHYAPMTVGNRFCNESLIKLEAAVAELETRELDLVVCLGDVIDKSETIEGELDCVKQVVACLDSLPANVHFVLGNHDVSELSKGQFLEACGESASYYSFDVRGVHIVALDSNFNPDGSSFAPGTFCWNDAWIGEDQIAWLKADLESKRDMPVLVFCHANLDDRILKNGSLNGHIVRDAALVRAVLESHDNIKAVVQGHDHRGHQSTINGIPYIVLRAMVEGSGCDNNAYAMLSLIMNGDVVLEGFAQQPTFRFGTEGTDDE